ncbi:hypothetical protein O0L34_g11683 [Tuta absoluta]|nr:hypothetical protein O0L34_g11683 [Tuta absoluta]
MSREFEGKVALVTGASAGIGEATALLLSGRGARVALVGRDAAALAALAARCGRGPAHLSIVADLATDEGCELVAKRTLEHFGRLDILVNNAGCGARQSLLTADMETFDRVFALNVRGVYNLTRLLAPALIHSKGNIVNVSSAAGSAVYLGALPYSMTKAALDHFTNLIALELAPKGVRVNAVSPGVTISKFVQRLTGYSDEEYAAWLRETEQTIPLGKVCTSEDVAQSIAYLAGSAAATVTGANLNVDGGVRFSMGASNLLQKQQQTGNQ